MHTFRHGTHIISEVKFFAFSLNFACQKSMSMKHVHKHVFFNGNKFIKSFFIENELRKTEVHLLQCITTITNVIIQREMKNNLKTKLTCIIRPLGYERVYLPLCKVADTPFNIEGDELSSMTASLFWTSTFTMVKGILWRQDSSLVAWLTQSPGVPGSSPAAADIFPWCTHMQ